MSQQPASKTNSQRSGDIAFLVVTIAAYMVVFANQVLSVRSWQFAAVIALGIAYTLIGTIGSRALENDPSPRTLILYFSAQIILGTTIILITRGAAWLLLLPTASQAIQYLSRRVAILVCALIWVVTMLPLGIMAGLQYLVGWGFALLAALVFVAAFTQLLVSEQAARRELAEAHRKLAEYAAQVETLATAQERNRLAREIHDGLGHYLTAINIQIKAASAVLQQNPESAQAALSAAQKLAEDALADVRRSISALRADPATARPLAETLEDLVEETRASGLSAELAIHGSPRPLPPQVEFALYRVAQEGLTNVRKHADASLVKLALNYAPDCIQLGVEDDGRGAETIQSGFGLLGVRERVELLGGTIQIDTARGKGFRICAEIPLRLSGQKSESA